MSDLKSGLTELKDCYEEKLMTREEYDEARKKKIKNRSIGNFKSGLTELKDCYEEKLMTREEYDEARKKIINKNRNKGSLKSCLTELKGCYDEKLMTREEYDKARKRRIALEDKRWWQKLIEGVTSGMLTPIIEYFIEYIVGKRYLTNN